MHRRFRHSAAVPACAGPRDGLPVVRNPNRVVSLVADSRHQTPSACTGATESLVLGFLR